ncbi:MAG: NADPH:quinone oxidoreductase family protein [Deltaproteobacteria bacterium]|nr:MAG: NADPH:quinone oxidoreductase family protein [Deltaproteobacteria bacterium]
MRAWRVHEYGDFREQLKLEEMDALEPQEGTSVLEVRAAGLMFADLLNIAGTYQVKAPLPFVPGCEVAGVVKHPSPDGPYQEGDRVVTLQMSGGFAEEMHSVDAMSFPIPDGMSFADAAALTVNYQTSYFALVHRSRLQKGETLLVHGGAGGVGTAAIQIGKALGANVIATASTPEKLQVCKESGADHVINYKESDFVSEVKNLTSYNGANVIYDPVGGDVFSKSTKCIAFGGRLITIGFASGKIPEISLNRVLVKNIDIVGLYWGNYQFQQPELIRSTQETLYGMYKEGSIKPVLFEEFAFDQLPDALASLAERRSYGKVILQGPGVE